MGLPVTYLLGVDLGTTFAAAAIARDGRVTSFGLGNQSHVIPSVITLTEDGEFLVGDPAERMSRVDPGAAAREFKRRFGDTTPYLLRGTPISAEALTGHLLGWIVRRVAQDEGDMPAGVRLTHPANWGQYQIDLLAESARLVDVGSVSFMTEPEAAAMHYASLQRIPDGETIAVYDLGGGTFDASVLRRDGDDFVTLGRPEGIARLGGIDFDEAMFGYVSRALGAAWNELDPNDPSTLIGLARLRRDCVAAKEDLSARTTTAVDVVLPGLTTEVRITRAEFEGLISLPIEETINAMRRAMTAAGVEAEELQSVLLVGGSSRVPLVAQMVSSALERPVAVDAHPKYAVSMGAAIAVELAMSGSGLGTPVVAPSPAVEWPAAIGIDDAVTHPVATVPVAPAPESIDGSQEEQLRVPLPVATVAAAPLPAPADPAPPAPEPVAAVPREKRVFPTTKHATMLLVLGLLALAGALAWAFLGNQSDEGIPAQQVAIIAPVSQ